jgi:hypothetical protein
MHHAHNNSPTRILVHIRITDHTLNLHKIFPCELVLLEIIEDIPTPMTEIPEVQYRQRIKSLDG